MSTLITIVGAIGAVTLLYGYAMVSTGRLSGDGLLYQVLNLGGAAALMVNSAYHAAWPSAILNLVWIGIGALALARVGAGRRGSGAGATSGAGMAVEPGMEATLG